MPPKEIEIARAVLKELKGRKGFDWWWDELDEDIKEEIETELALTVKRYL